MCFDVYRVNSVLACCLLADVTKPAVVLALAVDLCEALTVLHGANLVHRDIAARNVLLDDKWRPVLTDFGLSRSASSKSATVRICCAAVCSRSLVSAGSSKANHLVEFPLLLLTSLSRVVRSYYKAKSNEALPFCWLAPEAITDDKVRERFACSLC